MPVLLRPLAPALGGAVILGRVDPAPFFHGAVPAIRTLPSFGLDSFKETLSIKNASTKENVALLFFLMGPRHLPAKCRPRPLSGPCQGAGRGAGRAAGSSRHSRCRRQSEVPLETQGGTCGGIVSPPVPGWVPGCGVRAAVPCPAGPSVGEHQVRDAGLQPVPGDHLAHLGRTVVGELEVRAGARLQAKVQVPVER